MATRLQRGAKKTTTPSDAEPKKEDGHGKFLRLAIPRVNKAVKYITLVGNLASGAYVSTESEREQILTALDDAVTAVRVKLEKPAGKGGSAFMFK